MLGAARLVAFVATADPERARAFYENILGLRLVADDRFALVFDSQGVQLRIQKVDKVQPPPFTVLGWLVADLSRAVADLSTRGVSCERSPSMPQDDSGIWTAPGGARVAWFKDPDGNMLSITESAAD